MIVEIQNHAEPLSQLAETLIARRKTKLENFLTNVAPDAASLHIVIERVERKNLHTVKLVLNVPHKTLTAEKQGKDLVQTLGESFDALLREVKKYKEFYSQKPEYKRKRSTYRKALKPVDLEEKARELYLDFVEAIYPRLWNFALRELRHRINQGLIRPRDISLQEILDEAIVNVGNHLPEPYDESQIKHNLYRAIVSVLNREVSVQRIRRISLERKLQDSDLDTQIYEYYQPDEVLRLEDVIPAEESETPEAQYELDSLEETLEQILALLPATWRQAFLLTQLENFSPEEVAMIQGKDPQTVRREAEMTRAFIKEKLHEMGVEWEEAGVNPE